MNSIELIYRGLARTRLFIVVGIIATVFSVSEGFGQTCAAPPSGIAGWWQGETNANDAINGNTGVLVGGISYTNGKVGKAFNLPGNGSYVLLNNTTNLQLQNFTIEAWIQIGNPSQLTGGIATYGEVLGYGDHGYSFGITLGGNPFLTDVGVSQVTSSMAISDSAFHHVAMTKNSTNVVFYLDGVAGPALPFTSVFTFNNSPAIGGRADNGTGSFAGVIDEVAIYNRALSTVEIQTIYNSGSAGKCSGPTPAAINVQPADQNVVPGGNATFSVTPGGTPPFSYSWKFNGSNALSGATNSTLTVSNAQIINAGTYQVTVTNAYGSAISRAANLAVQGPPVIVSQSGPQTILPGASVLFFVDASGTDPLFFRWRLNGTNLSVPNDYSLAIVNAQATNAGTYTVVVSNAFGSVTSAPIVLTLLLPPTITNQPQNQTNYVGGNAYFTVGASTSASSTLFYQWRFNGTNILGANRSNFVAVNLQSASAGDYSVVVTNIFGSTISSNALLTVVNPSCEPMPTGLVAWWQGEGSAGDVISGAPGTLVGNATYSSGKVGKAFNFNAGNQEVLITNSSSLQLQNFTIEAWIQIGRTNLLTGGTGPYGEIFGYGSQGYGLGISTSGILYLTRVDVSQVSDTRAITDGAFHHVAVTKNGISVVFYLDGIPGPTLPYTDTFLFTTLPSIGARSDTFNNAFLGSIDEMSVYSRALSATEVQLIYAATTLGKCAVPLAVQSYSTNQTVVFGSNTTLSVNVAGTGPITYQWYQNGAVINGATNATLSFGKANYFEAGTYSVTIVNSLGAITVSNITLILQPSVLLVNGSFETGDFTGWVTNDLSLPLYPLTVRTNGFNPEFGFFLSAPSDGIYCATDGFEGNGPGKISIAQDVFLPSGAALLTFDYRAAWDVLDYGGSTLPRTFAVSVQPAGGGIPLHTFTVLTAAAQTVNFDTGASSGSFDLTPYSGQRIRISFDQTIPEAYSGPGFFQLDHVALSYSFLPPLAITKNSNNVVLSWPVSTTNYTLQTTTNLGGSATWNTVNSNLFAHSLTNTSITLTPATRQTYYRLKYP